jgi:LmbE family N-acetylglucosaminyl deacetylase
MDHKTALVLAPHTDDAELGCGGTIARLCEEGVTVHVAAFSTAEESLPADMPKDTLRVEFQHAMPKLGVPPSNVHVYSWPVRKLNYHRQDVLEELVRLRAAIKPDLVFLPSGNDLHQDHQVLHAEGLRAFKDLSVLGYELPWNHITFSAQAFFILEKHHLDKKWDALLEYKSQFVKQRNYFTREFIDGQARVRGTMVKAEFAEAFEVYRIKW